MRMNPVEMSAITGLAWRALALAAGFAMLGADCTLLVSSDDDDDFLLRPTADAGSDRVVPVGDTVVLDGSDSDDNGLGTLTFDWALVTVPAGSTAALSDADTPTPRFTADRAGAYTAELVVTAGGVDSRPDQVTVTATDDGASASVDAGAVRLSSAVATPLRLPGRAGPNDATAGWRVVAGPAAGAGRLAGAGVAPVFRASRPGEYRLVLTVRGPGGHRVDDVLRIDVEAGNVAPNADAGDDVAARVGETVRLDGRASTDPDGEALTYRWRILHRPPGSGALPLDAHAPVTRLVPDVPGDYLLQLVVNDGWRESASDNVLVTTGSAMFDR